MFPTLQQQKDPLSISREHNILKGPVSVSKSSVKEGVFFGCFLCLGGKEKSIFITALEYSLVSIGCLDMQPIFHLAEKTPTKPISTN